MFRLLTGKITEFDGGFLIVMQFVIIITPTLSYEAVSKMWIYSISGLALAIFVRNVRQVTNGKIRINGYIFILFLAILYMTGYPLAFQAAKMITQFLIAYLISSTILSIKNKNSIPNKILKSIRDYLAAGDENIRSAKRIEVCRNIFSNTIIAHQMQFALTITITIAVKWFFNMSEEIPPEGGIDVRSKAWEIVSNPIVPFMMIGIMTMTWAQIKDLWKEEVMKDIHDKEDKVDIAINQRETELAFLKISLFQAFIIITTNIGLYEDTSYQENMKEAALIIIILIIPQAYLLLRTRAELKSQRQIKLIEEEYREKKLDKYQARKAPRRKRYR